MTCFKPIRLALLAPVLAACAGPPVARPGEILGYGTPGVESYGPPGGGATLAELRARCRMIPDGAPQPQTLAAACDQLHRTLNNQPGSTLASPP